MGSDYYCRICGHSHGFHDPACMKGRMMETTKDPKRHPAFDMKPEAGKWYFEFIDSWCPAGAYDSADEALAAATEFFRRGTTSRWGQVHIAKWRLIVAPAEKPQHAYRSRDLEPEETQL